MPKTIKGLAGKKPPEPSADHGEIEAVIPHLMPRVQPLVARLDELICATIPGLHFTAKRGRPHYGLPDLGWIIEVAPYHLSVNVVFYGGADFDSPPPLGTTDRTRYIKLTAIEEVDSPELAAWLEQAARTPGWKAPG
jgi:hypothetical protein